MIVAIVGGPCTGKSKLASEILTGRRKVTFPASLVLPGDDLPHDVALHVPDGAGVLSLDPLMLHHKWHEQSLAAAKVVRVFAEVGAPMEIEGSCLVRAVRHVLELTPSLLANTTMVLMPPLTRDDAVTRVRLRSLTGMDPASVEALAAKYVLGDRQVRTILQNMTPDLVRAGVKIIQVAPTGLTLVP